MPEARDFPYDVFLSHNHADKPRVRRLAERLKAAGVRVWLDEWVIQAGDIIRSGATSMWTSARNPRRRLRKWWLPVRLLAELKADEH